MKRMASLLAAPLALLALGSGVAIAASSPTVSTDAATKVTDTSESLQATINPNGNSTGYVFQYGLTNSYGLTSGSGSAGSGSKAVKVTKTVTGLTPGTAYHYRIAATNRAGTALGRDRTFKTGGFPPAAVVTGSPSSVRKTIATLTGTIDPMGAPTTWVLQYGLTASYGLETFAQPIGSGTSSSPVSATLAGLAPATLFHYRVVAYHNNVATYGGDATFFTEPDRRPKPRMSASTKPGVIKKKPYAFATNGILRGASFIPASSRCTGTVDLRYYKGRKRVASVAAPVGSDCRFGAQETVAKRFIHGPTRLRIAVQFLGNGYLAPASHTDYVTAG